MSDIKIKDTIIELRKQKKLTQKQLAEHINYSDKVISKWECGESYPDILALKTLSKFFNVSIDEIVDGSILKDSTEVSPSMKLNVVKTHHPSLLAKIWIIIPFILLISSIFYGLERFGFSLFIFGIIFFIYGFSINNYVFEAVYQEHTIKLVNRLKSCELYINDHLVDGIYGIFHFNPELSGIIDDKHIHVKISNLTSIKCDMFVR
jgi:transcriptional regulator with XRE-family HTH domain